MNSQNSINNQNITFVVYSFNEEARIEACLKNLHGYGKILVIDNHSTDRTMEIAQRYADRIVQRRNKGHSDDDDSFEFLWSNVNTEWMYRAYSGEALPAPLLERLVEISRDPCKSLVRIAKRTVSYGIETRNWGTGYHARLARRHALSYKGCVIHQNGVIMAESNEIVTLPRTPELCIWHYRDYTAKKTEEVFTNYLDRDAVESYQVRGKRFSPLRIIFGTLFFLIVPYIRSGAFLRGWPAFFNAFWIAVYEFNKQVRLWEMENGWTIDSVRAKHMEQRNMIFSVIEANESQQNN